MPEAASPAIRTVEDALRQHHVVALAYTTREGVPENLRIEPLAIRFNRSAHRVLWAWDRDADHLEQLLLTGITAATDTGETFTPRQWLEEPDHPVR